METVDTHTLHNPQLLFTWTAPIRAYKKRSAGVLRFYIAVALLLSLIAFFFGDKILVMPIAAVTFLFYILTITPSASTENKITTFGIETGGNTYRFDSLSHFYFVKKYDYQVLVVVARPPYYSHVYLVISDKSIMNQVIKLLSEHLIYQERPHKTFTDRCVEVLTNLIPTDTTNKKHEAMPHQEMSIVNEAGLPAPL